MHPHVAHLFVRVGETKNGGGERDRGADHQRIKKEIKGALIKPHISDPLP